MSEERRGGDDRGEERGMTERGGKMTEERRRGQGRGEERWDDRGEERGDNRGEERGMTEERR